MRKKEKKKMKKAIVLAIAIVTLLLLSGTAQAATLDPITHTSLVSIPEYTDPGDTFWINHTFTSTREINIILSLNITPYADGWNTMALLNDDEIFSGAGNFTCDALVAKEGLNRLAFRHTSQPEIVATAYRFDVSLRYEPPEINEAIALSPMVAWIPGDIGGGTYWRSTEAYLVVNVTGNCFPCHCEAEANFSEMIRKMLQRVDDIPEETMVEIIEVMNEDFGGFDDEDCCCEEEGYNVLCNDFDAMYFVRDLVEELHNYGIVESEADAMTLLLEKIELGDFVIPINVTDCCGNYNNEAEIELTIVDVMVPLKQGWNVRSTPIALKHSKWSVINELGDGLDYDKAYMFDLETQLFKVVPGDYKIEPLEAFYIHMRSNDQLGTIMLRHLTAPPERDLVRGWNLVGMALPIFSDMPIEEALVTIEVAAGAGDRGYNQVLSFGQHVEYDEELEYPCCCGDCSETHYNFFRQELWVFTYGSSVSEDADNCGGYWINMENDDKLGGFTGTPPMFEFGG